jgi:hemolysin activation/secretion protein
VALEGSYTTAEPSSLLRQSEIESQSATLGATLTYQMIRQRQENFLAHLGLDGRNTNSDTFDTPLTRDRIRAVRAGATYDAVDGWEGYNVVDLTLSQGLAIFGASRESDPDLSRTEAESDFRKAEVWMTRQQMLGGDWALVTSATGQLASGALYSSEEFGYGGQAFGRAYDASEITGDHGITGAIEVRYLGLDLLEPVRLVPYVFYDVGKIWNADAGQEQEASGSSAGVGLRMDMPWGLSGQIGLAQPLTREVVHPLYGDGNAPRLSFELHWAWSR